MQLHTEPILRKHALKLKNGICKHISIFDMKNEGKYEKNEKEKRQLHSSSSNEHWTCECDAKRLRVSLVLHGKQQKPYKRAHDKHCYGDVTHVRFHYLNRRLGILSLLEFAKPEKLAYRCVFFVARICGFSVSVFLFKMNFILFYSRFNIHTNIRKRFSRCISMPLCSWATGTPFTLDSFEAGALTHTHRQDNLLPSWLAIEISFIFSLSHTRSKLDSLCTHFVVRYFNKVS